VIAELCAILERHGRINDSAAFLNAVINRESLCPTSTAPGWALPHARHRGITQLSFVLARSAQPLVWFGEGTIRPQIIFLFAVPEAEAKTYLSVVAAVAKLSQNLALLAQLHTAPDAQAMIEVLGQVPLRGRGLATAVSPAIR
jgi:mannitol/fructose-specific phosphotransferase system IIA component (Ntr-type)